MGRHYNETPNGSQAGTGISCSTDGHAGCKEEGEKPLVTAYQGACPKTTVSAVPTPNTPPTHNLFDMHWSL